ncbi:hypothetical protein ACGFIG_27260 [Micromonospora sp. NPDC049048]|uniref:hypothetical protein n=1 Tax=Micromonospora sp. NPDC049048 TaxID=3364263 RepID=UPI00370F7E44
MRSADLPDSYRASRLVVLASTLLAVAALVAWALHDGVPQAVAGWAAEVLRDSWSVWTLFG